MVNLVNNRIYINRRIYINLPRLINLKMNRQALYSAKPSASVNAHHMALRHARQEAHTLMHLTLLKIPSRGGYPCNRNFGCNEVTPEPPKPKQNVNVGNMHVHM